jgi:hypothetical protein
LDHYATVILAAAVLSGMRGFAAHQSVVMALFTGGVQSIRPHMMQTEWT